VVIRWPLRAVDQGVEAGEAPVAQLRDDAGDPRLRLSVVWSFLYWISVSLFLLSQIYLAVVQNWERFFHNWYMAGMFVSIQVVVGLVQLTTASYYNDGGKTLKYIVFAPWYMLIYWMINTWTLVYESGPTVRKIWALRGAGTWKSPERSTSLQDLDQPRKRRQ